MLNLKETEEKIKKYYAGLKRLEQLEHQLQAYKNRETEIQNKINNSNINLNCEIGAVSYDNVGGGCSGLKTSQQERSLNNAFIILEKRLEDVQAEILLTEDEISSIKAENSKMEMILKNLKHEYRIIMEYIYKDYKGAVKASFDLHMDRATIYRKKDKVIKEAMKWFNFYAV